MPKTKQPTHPISNLEDLQSLFSSPSNPIFIAINFEGINNILSGFHPSRVNAQTGLSILDPLNLNLSTTSPHFQIYNFITGSNTYSQISSQKGLWGSSERIARSEMLHKIQSCFPKDRVVVLIGHGVQAELAVLDALDYDLESVHVVFDTYELGQEMGIGECSLRNLLGKLGYFPPETQFHTAGNDATFTLWVFLLLMVKDLEACCPLHQEVNALKEVAGNGFEVRGDAVVLPDQTNKWTRTKPAVIYGVEVITRQGKNYSLSGLVEDRTVKKQELEPPKRFLAKSWTIEMQEAIREERRRRRASARENANEIFGGSC